MGIALINRRSLTINFTVKFCKVGARHYISSLWRLVNLAVQRVRTPQSIECVQDKAHRLINLEPQQQLTT